jgi:hypothetical protein
MTTPTTEITTITLRAMRAKLEEAATIARRPKAWRLTGSQGGLMIGLDVELLAVEANSLLQGLAVLNRIAGHELDEAGG